MISMELILQQLMENLKEIFEESPNLKYVLDPYHLSKYVIKMTAHLHKSYEKYF